MGLLLFDLFFFSFQTQKKMVSRENPIFKTKESIFTISLVTFEAVIICILEGIVIMNHLGLVQNCDLDKQGKGI